MFAKLKTTAAITDNAFASFDQIKGFKDAIKGKQLDELTENMLSITILHEVSKHT